MISQSQIVDILEHIFKIILEHKLDVKYFKIVMLIGLLHFKKMNCDYVVLECGIGAKLDNTNVVEAKDVACSVITSIGHDHMELLGNSLEEIALDKAHVIKQDGIVVLGPSCSRFESIKNFAEDKNSKLVQVAEQDSF